MGIWARQSRYKRAAAFVQNAEMARDETPMDDWYTLGATECIAGSFPVMLEMKLLCAWAKLLLAKPNRDPNEELIVELCYGAGQLSDAHGQMWQRLNKQAVRKRLVEEYFASLEIGILPIIANLVHKNTTEHDSRTPLLTEVVAFRGTKYTIGVFINVNWRHEWESFVSISIPRIFSDNQPLYSNQHELRTSQFPPAAQVHTPEALASSLVRSMRVFWRNCPEYAEV